MLNDKSHKYVIILYTNTLNYKIFKIYYCFGGESDDVYKVSFKTGEYITGVEGTTGPFIEDRSFDLLSQVSLEL